MARKYDEKVYLCEKILSSLEENPFLSVHSAAKSIGLGSSMVRNFSAYAEVGKLPYSFFHRFKAIFSARRVQCDLCGVSLKKGKGVRKKDRRGGVEMVMIFCDEDCKDDWYEMEGS